MNKSSFIYLRYIVSWHHHTAAKVIDRNTPLSSNMALNGLNQLAQAAQMVAPQQQQQQQQQQQPPPAQNPDHPDPPLMNSH